MKLKSISFFILLLLRQQFVQFWIEQQEEKSQQGSASSGVGWIFSTDGNSQSSSESKTDLWQFIVGVCWPEAPRKQTEYSLDGVTYVTAWHYPFFQQSALYESFNYQRSSCRQSSVLFFVVPQPWQPLLPRPFQLLLVQKSDCWSGCCSTSWEVSFFG